MVYHSYVMKKWDYKFIKITLPIASGINIQSDGTTQTEKTIKDFGAEGWELVSVTPMSELHYEIKNYEETGKTKTYEAELIFKKPVED